MNIILIGDSGHSKVIYDNVVSAGSRVVARLDDKYTDLKNVDGCWMGPVSAVYDLMEKEQAKVIIAIGSNHIRQKIVERLSLPSDQYATVVHEKAIISPTTSIGHGTVVMPGAILNASASIGNHVILNTGLVVEHDCEVGDYVHISPGAVITGGVKIEDGVHIGAGATVIPLKEIGQWSIVGAGSVVIDNVNEFSTVAGVPARTIKKDNKSV